MGTHDKQRSDLIGQMMQSEAIQTASSAILPLQSLAPQLVSIIGEGGMYALYARSLHKIAADFPWLDSVAAAHSHELWLIDLRKNFATQSTEQARQAAQALLLSCTNILATLIGETLTIDLLKSAWANELTSQDGADKE
jgi:hypothetical protein